jgi:mono/diheme cytochrome c family protein
MKLKVIGAVLLGCLTLFNCSHRDEKENAVPAEKALSDAELIARGKYLTTVSGCHDCHSPKIMTPEGPEPDPTRLLSGHPKKEDIPKVIATRDWILFSNNLTAAVGPWGVSYAANLTPDDTGIGNWTFKQFETAIRKGKYKGLEGGRPLLPPMPWQMFRNMTDDDLRSIFAYLKSIPPVDNLVPTPIAPDKLLSQTK